MGKYVEILIRADVPDGNDELAHDAIVQSREPVTSIVMVLEELGLSVTTQTRRIGSTKPGAGRPKVVAAAAE